MMLAYYCRLAVLNIVKTPTLSLLVVLVMGLGIALPGTYQSVRSNWLSNPLPHKEGRLYNLQLQSLPADVSGRGQDGMPLQLSYQDAMALHQNDIPQRQAAMLMSGATVKAQDGAFHPFVANIRVTDSDFFALFDVPFLYGAAWDKALDRDGKAVVVISQALNQRLFGGGENLGKTLLLDDRLYQVVGIIDHWSPIPKLYDLTASGSLGASEEVFIPFSLFEPLQLDPWGMIEGTPDGAGWYQGERPLAQYWVELQTPQDKALYEAYLGEYIRQQQRLGRFPRADAEYRLRSGSHHVRDNVRIAPQIDVMLLVGYLFLAVCLVNLLALLLSKELQQRERIGIYRALGARRSDIYWQVFLEVVLLGLPGALLGMVLSWLGLQAVRSSESGFAPVTQADSTFVLIVLGISLVSTLLVGLYPAYRVCRLPVNQSLKSH